MRIFLVSLILLSITNGCSPSRDKKGRGGVDGGGGGGFIYHSKEDVVKAIDEVQAELTGGFIYNPVTVAKRILKTRKNKTRDEKTAYKVINKILSGDHSYASKKIHLEMNDLCTGPHDQKYLASVTKLDRSGDVCMSVFGLMRTPSGSLRHDLHGLMIHEAAHLNGFGEEEARTTQQFFIKNILSLLNLTTDEAKYEHARNAWLKIIGMWPLLLTYEEIDQNYIAQVANYADRVSRMQGVPNSINRTIGRRELAPIVRANINSLTERIRDYAESLYTGLQIGNSRISSQHLQTVRKLAYDMADLSKLYNLYIMGTLGTEGMLRVVRNEDFEFEINLIREATDPITLTDVEKRPKLLCTNQEEDAEISKERNATLKLGQKLEPFRCNPSAEFIKADDDEDDDED